MQTIKASVFKAKCLHLMDWVHQTGEEIIITKNGKPVSRLAPYQTTASSLFGLHKDVLQDSGDLLSVDESWYADR